MARSRTRKRVCKFVLAGLFVLLVLAGLFVGRKVQAQTCTDQESRETLRKLCEDDAKRKVTGNLCPDLCTAHSVIYRECLNYKKGKKVMLADWNSRKVILKSKYGLLQEYDSIVSKYVNDDGVMSTSKPDMANFLMMMKSQLRTMFEVEMPDVAAEEFVHKMWQMPWKNNAAMNVATMESLWALLQQDEYLMMQYFQGNKHFPKIYGSCGHFYVMEYTPTGNILDPQFFNFKTAKKIGSTTDWDKRANVALNFLTFLEDLDTFYSEPLHICDVKQDNYGVTADMTIQAIDVDMAFFESKMQGILGQENCSKDRDCDFFDCTSSCDLTHKRCSKHRTNNNLQVVCEKIFLGFNGLPFGGLLRSPPADIADRLNRALKDCVDPPTDEGRLQTTPTDMLQTIRNILQETLQTA